MSNAAYVLLLGATDGSLAPLGALRALRNNYWTIELRLLHFRIADTANDAGVVSVLRENGSEVTRDTFRISDLG